MINPLKEVLDKRGQGAPGGICSVCSANEYVLLAAMQEGKKYGSSVLIEATANQVNQFGGYTGMTPSGFYEMAHKLAARVGLPDSLLILGGDHLGPLTWQAEDEQSAMQKAETLIEQFVLAGYAKIHIDTSMRLGSDSKDAPLPVETVARRSAQLARVAERAFERRLAQYPDAVEPVYIIGSEVPIPGGAQQNEDSVAVTRPEDFCGMMEIFADTYRRSGLEKAWSRVAAVVVQPGVEFSDDSVVEYNAEKAKALIETLAGYPGLVFEGHSTDYQTRRCLREMVRDGIAILKVGPALTFAMREGLFALEMMEREVCTGNLSNFRATLDDVMKSDGRYWQKYYHGTPREIALKRAFSYSDRCRYYMTDPRVLEAIARLMENLNSTPVPRSVLSQYMPIQYARVHSGELSSDPQALVCDRVRDFLDDYRYAVNGQA